ncbi:septal ring lytic transglycosylase RlpA family protein [Hymenobacter sp. HMF4947]|uniref:Probable endolytic peptidoglycan transglycosylase RlpA n=2 Tax=Hymenobacter ginkgonis TaxID=2682976 RepID=A0A7K1TJ01_9BACT|nr:septal ring lytic transglycosylase RlpA family protein [Hymenobacter ginkgonis]
MHFTFLNTYATRLSISVLAIIITACGGSKSAFTQSGDGSYYADKFAGRATASGVPYRPGKLTAAHNTLPFGTRIRVTNVRTGRSVKVVVNDRGPHAKGRIVDVSKRAAGKLGLLDAGVAPVKLKVIRAAPAKR